MSNKTPYELRFDILSMARDLVCEEVNQQINAFWTLQTLTENALNELEGKVGDEFDRQYQKLQDLISELKENIPSSASPDEIKKRAKELYEFVEQK